MQRAVAGAGHCAIDARTRERAFDDLLAWMQGGATPRGDDFCGRSRPDGTIGSLRWRQTYQVRFAGVRYVW